MLSWLVLYMTLSLHQYILPQSVLHDPLGFVQHHLLPPAGSFHVPYDDPCPLVLHLHYLLPPDHDLFHVPFHVLSHDLCSGLHYHHHLLPPDHDLFHVPFHVLFHDLCSGLYYLYHLFLPDHDLFHVLCHVPYHVPCPQLHHLQHLLLFDLVLVLFHILFLFLLYHYLALHIHHCFQHSFGILRFHVYQDYAHFGFPFQM